MAVKEGKVLATGSRDELFEKFNFRETKDVEGKYVFPGLIDAHCHFYGYGKGLNEVDVVGTKSLEEVLERTVTFVKEHDLSKEISKTDSSAGTVNWITGRGWDQNDWSVKEFPDRRKLDSLFPNTPVFLKRIDGHAALANKKALELAGITSKTRVSGGDILTFAGKTEPTGVLIDNAVDLVENKIPKASKDQIVRALLKAQENCLAAGVYAMLTPNEENLSHYISKGPYKTDKLNVCSFKFYGDGALGSRGACLLSDYSDKKGWNGFMLNTPDYFSTGAKKMMRSGFQMNTHCIGDSSVKAILNIYAENMKESPHKRWRIEHVQIADPSDLKAYGNYFIPSVQPTHATSDMYWAEQRLGKERVKTAYAYKDLLRACGTIALGTDFPVEDISPFKTFYAAVYRKDAKGFPENGYQMENALTREETIRGMTIWAAYSNFEEKEKGSLTKGKWADFVILDTDLMTCPEGKILSTKVISTYIAGEEVYKK
ncbi:MAG: amidohydrolase [Bacteroidetes bacterium]|nr:amidohydrolase [Bacteroidota bacterium]